MGSVHRTIVKLKYQDTVQYIKDNRMYRVSIEQTKTGGAVIQDIETKTYKEVPLNSLIIIPSIPPTPLYNQFDRVFLENYRVNRVFIVKSYNNVTEQLEVFPLGQREGSFHIHRRYIKLSEGLV